MRRNRLRQLSIICCLLLSSLTLASIPKPARADDLQQQLQKYQQQVNDLNGQLATQKQKEAVQSTKVIALRQSMQTLKDSIARYQTSLADQQKKLDSLEVKKKDLETLRQQHITELGRFLRNNYEEGSTVYLEVLLDAKGFTDFLTRLEDVHTIVNTYSRLQEEIGSLSQEIDDQQLTIQQSTNALKATLNDKQRTQDNLQQLLDSEQQVLSQMTTQEKTTLNARVIAQDKANVVQRLIEQERLEAALAAQDPVNSSSRGGVNAPVSITGGSQSILSYAQQYIGTPYVWGGTNAPPGFDCSGFVQYVFRHFGVSLDRTSQAQFQDGIAVSHTDLRPGDLVFFSTYGRGATHVGIYAGNNTMIDSSSDGVSYNDLTNSYWAPRYIGALRVLSN